MSDLIPLTLFYIISAFGLAYIVGHAEISAWARDTLYGFAVFGVHPFLWVVKMVECPACFGFWTGFVGGLWLIESFVRAIFCGCFICATNYLLGRATGLIARPRPESEKK